MLSANQTAGFLNQLFPQNKLMKQLYFLHADTNSQKLKVVRKCFGLVLSKYACGQSGLCALTDLKDYLKNELFRLTDFLHAEKIRKAKIWFNDFWVGMVKNGHCFLVRETLLVRENLLYLKIELINWADVWMLSTAVALLV